MLAVAVCSLRGAPGATTAAAALAATWPVGEGDRVVLVESDPAGGVIASRWNLTEDPGLLDLASARGVTTMPELSDIAQAWTESAGVVVAPSDPDAAAGLLSSGSAVIVDALTRSPHTIIVDVGRLAIKSMALPLAARSVRTVVVCPRRLDAVAGMAPWINRLRDAGVIPVMVTVGKGPYSAHEVAAAAGLDLVGSLPDDPRGAALLWGGDRRRFKRSMLWRSARQIASSLAAEVTTPATPPPQPPPNVTSPTSEGSS